MWRNGRSFSSIIACTFQLYSYNYWYTQSLTSLVVARRLLDFLLLSVDDVDDRFSSWHSLEKIRYSLAKIHSHSHSHRSITINYVRGMHFSK